MPPRRFTAGQALVPAAIAALTLLVFLPSLGGQFLTWDDDRNFLMNPSYRGLGWSQIHWMFTTFHLGPYQPLSWLTLGFDYARSGMDPFGYHLTNVLLHAANAALVYLFAKQLLQFDGPGGPAHARQVTIAAAVAALFFALHPLRVESVAWVTERRDVLSGLFLLLTLIAYVHAASLRQHGKPVGRWLALSLVFFTLSLLSKASAMMLAGALVFVDVWLLRRTSAGPKNASPMTLQAVLIEKVPFAVLGAVTGIVAAIGQKSVGVVTTVDQLSPAVRLARAAYGTVFYLWKTVAPFQLSNLYEVLFRSNPFDWHFLVAAAVVIGLTAGTYLLRGNLPALFVAWMSYAILLFPVSGIAHGGGQILGDRYSYQPGLAWALVAGGATLWLLRSVRAGSVSKGLGQLANAGIAAVLITFTTLTVVQQSVWHDSTALWAHAFSRHPLEALRRAGPSREADVLAYEATLRTLGDQSAYWAICYNYATALRTDRRFEEAAAVYADSARVNPANMDARNGWAATLIDLHRYDDAVAQLDDVLRAQPAHIKANFNLGLARAAQGRKPEAVAAYRRTLDLDPRNAEAHYNLGVMLADLGTLDEAAAEYRRALDIEPNYAEACNNLGVVLGRQGKVAEAVEAFRRTLAINPKHPGAQSNLARALDLLKRGG